MAEFVPFFSDGALEIAFWRNVAIVDIVGDLTLARARQLGPAYRALLADHPEGIVVFAMIRAGVPVSSAESRSEATRVVKELGRSLLVSIMVVEDNGVFAQVMRTVIRGVNVLMRSSKMVAFADVDEASLAVARFVPPPGEGADLAGELRALLRMHRRQVPLAPALRQAR